MKIIDYAKRIEITKIDNDRRLKLKSGDVLCNERARTPNASATSIPYNYWFLEEDNGCLTIFGNSENLLDYFSAHGVTYSVIL